MDKLSRSEADLMHKHTAIHIEEIMRSSRCWCISCEREFLPSEIDDWTDNGETAICPYCHIDAVIGDASGLQLSKQLLRCLNKIYF